MYNRPIISAQSIAVTEILSIFSQSKQLGHINHSNYYLFIALAKSIGVFLTAEISELVLVIECKSQRYAIRYVMTSSLYAICLLYR